MKKFGLLLFITIVFSTSMLNVTAACDTKVLNKARADAYKMTSSYEEATEEMEEGTYDPPDGYSAWEDYKPIRTFFKIYVTNMTENVYIKVKDTYLKEEKTYRYEDSVNGVITIESDILMIRNTYTIEVYASDINCTSKLRTLTVRLPMYNEYSDMSVCDNAQEYYLCQKYVDFDMNVSFEELSSKVSEYLDRQNATNDDKEKPDIADKIFEKNKAIAIATGVVIVAVGIGVTVVIIVRRRRVV